MNKRVLVIDDEKEIQNDYLLILSEQTDDPLANLGALEESLFGEEPKQVIDEEIFDVTVAAQGEEGVNHVIEARKANDPFAVAFVDMRMPPGIDGLETSKLIRQNDPDIELVIVTAYSDRPRIDIVNEVGTPSKLIYLKKPFDSEEIKQLARALMEKWNLNMKERRMRDELIKMLHNISKMKNIGMEDLKQLLSFILVQVISFFDQQNGFIIRNAQNTVDSILGVGKYENNESLIHQTVEEIKVDLFAISASPEVNYVDRFTVIPFPVSSLDTIYLLIEAKIKQEMDTELLAIFIENAASAINNAIKFRNAHFSRIREILSGVEQGPGKLETTTITTLSSADISGLLKSFWELINKPDALSATPDLIMGEAKKLAEVIGSLAQIARDEEGPV